MNYLEHFSPDYFTARSRFREAAERHDVVLTDYPVGDAGHTVDAARFGPLHSESLLILSSGLHGIEGPFGSAVQLAFLAGMKSLPPGVGVLLLHALSPIGYDRRRRFNEDNVDLNRNFLDPAEFPGLREESLQSLYADLDPYLNPKSPPSRFDGFPLIATWLLLRYGRKRLRQTLPVGQYSFPKGLFFGGDRLAASTRLVMDRCGEWVGPAQRILHLDWHTGLGDRATHKLLCHFERDHPKAILARSIFGNAIETPEGETAYRARGDIGVWLNNHFSDRDYLYLCAEFGTYSNTRTLKALRRENRAEHYSPPSDLIRDQTKAELSEMFVPTSPEWRIRVILDSLEIIQRGLTKWAV